MYIGISAEIVLLILFRNYTCNVDKYTYITYYKYRKSGIDINEINNARFSNCKRFYVTEDIYNLSITEVKTKEGNMVKVYDIERSICDII